jgi:hypothetical protein
MTFYRLDPTMSVVPEALHPAIRDDGQAPLHDKESATSTGREGEGEKNGGSMREIEK